ncbi:hypothetical protein LMG29739_05674 [Paraburkholderia solisilvae]|uniref:Transposase IS66 central domain-containing protein n=1 Tax=Paraburkholderia solisilvae TaxID=624376 RepID=A0A6J5EX59_9BURK|nr:hypothetical protein LMG29739_05674 [Paraburkholderia solisilvae]
MRVRREHARSLLDQLHAWLTATLETLSKKSDTIGAIRYALKRWKALMRYCDPSALEIDSLLIEGALRGKPVKMVQ